MNTFRPSLPLHVIGKEAPETERRVAEFIVRRPALLQEYGGLLASLHPGAWEEVEAMAKTKAKRGGFDFHLEPLIKAVGLKRVIEAAGVERVIETVGVERVIQAVGLQRVIREKGVEWLLAQMSPEQRRELKEHLT